MARYIDADELKNHLIKNRGYVLGHLLHLLLEDIDNQPTADVQEVKNGKWVEYEKGMVVTSYKCSLCGEVVMDDTGYDVVKDYPYCHCGAKMENE